MAAQTSARGAGEIAAGMLMEELERRVLLDSHPFGAPFPTLGDLESADNTVVRLETNMGTIDIELFDRAGPGGDSGLAAPVTTANFLNYVKTGRFDEVIFHRLVEGFVVQGGAFRIVGEGEGDVQQTQTDDPIVNEFDPGRSNVERTLAMAKLPGDPDSATNQFFINLGDNSANLDIQNGGFTVFARVANEASWGVVLDIAALDTINLVGMHGAFTDVPSPDPSGGIADRFVHIIDSEVIKPAGSGAFFEHRLYFPEGFTSETVTEFVPIGNPNDQPVRIQVIARAEVPGERRDGDDHWPVQVDRWHRDFVIAEQTVEARTRGGITISRAANPVFDLLPRDIPYAIEIHSTLPVSAMLSHYDFGSATGEAFTPETATRWGFGESERDTVVGGLNEFLLWQNPGASPVDVTVTFYFRDQSPIVHETTTQPLRRGGLAVANMAALPGKPMSIVVEASEPIVAALTRFDSRGEEPLGTTALGVPGDASVFGAVPNGKVGQDADFKVTFVNPSATQSAVISKVTLAFDDADGSTFEVVPAGPNFPGFPIPPERRATLDLAGVVPQQLRGENFSLRFISNTPVYAHATQFELNDTVENPMAVSAAQVHQFAEGFMNHTRAGDDILETISVFNPVFADFAGGTAIEANITLTFYYTDGSTVTETRVVEPGRGVNVDLHTVGGILAKSQQGLRFYSIEVTSDIPVIAQMFHYDFSLGSEELPSGGFSTLSTMFGDIIRLDKLAEDPDFQA